jgi:hypothetical protein
MTKLGQYIESLYYILFAMEIKKVLMEWGGNTCGWGEWLCRVAKMARCPACHKVQGLNFPGCLIRDLPLSTVLADTAMCILDLRDTAWQ